MEAHGAQPSEERYVHKRDREERGGEKESLKWISGQTEAYTGTEG